MNALFLMTVAGFGILMCQAATTVHPHHSHHTRDPNHTHAPHTGPTMEPHEKESFAFFYNPMSHMMILHNGHLCYIVTMTADELSNVHTDAGIRATEIRILTTLGSATEVTGDTLSANDIKHCGKSTQHYYTV